MTTPAGPGRSCARPTASSSCDPDLGVLPKQADELQAILDTVRTGVPGVSTLTTAEVHLLPLLPTHLNFSEIGQRLYLSKHTVKT